ncbi:hypothetical protein NLX86_01210 [Streptomyces sp. A3M-1-3]|uniref:hypothetical protein n=1 Tax=Streptomyces sp. A3M-1-3 TaxID=2962044 RepID=UPI0020B73969|nr:hypothetical protein [Streptomyces sp. A3M-1-3]MCP3816804.1 hypothetical protein [Streptomyces sp. A3M-1-3]
MDTKNAATPDTGTVTETDTETDTDTDTDTDTKAVATADVVDVDDDRHLDTADTDADEAHRGDDSAAERSVIGAGAAAVVGAGLGVASLTGTWVSRVVAERQMLIGQIETAQSATPAQQISALYGDAWHMTALVNGAFAVLALLVGLFVLARPAFGAPGRTQPVWVRSFAWGAVALGALGLLIAGLMYSDVLVSLPKPGS